MRRYFPSAPFMLIIGSFVLSAGLVYAANLYTHPKPATPASVGIAVDSTTPPADPNWEATLYAIQAQNASSSIQAPSQNSVSTLLSAAQSQNLTDSVARTLFINLSNAKSQGLGDDIPTQDQLISQAISQAKGSNAAKAYTAADLTIVPDSDAALRAYGNGVMEIFAKHPEASQRNTFIAIGYATDYHDAAPLDQLPPIEAGYEAITEELAALPVPKTLAPFHISVVNDFSKVTASYEDMRQMIADPLRGLMGLQTYQDSLDETGRVFTNIADSLNKDGIIFNKDEAGSAWSAYLSP